MFSQSIAYRGLQGVIFEGKHPHVGASLLCGKESACLRFNLQEPQVQSMGLEVPLEKGIAFLIGRSQGQGSLAGYSPWTLSVSLCLTKS